MAGRRCLILFVVLFICACGRTGTPTTQSYESIAELLDALDAAGAEIVTAGLEATLFNVDSRHISLNGDKAELYEFKSADGSASAVIQLPALLEEAGTTTQDDLSSVRLWAHDRLIVVYYGRDGGTILLLSGLLGDPLQEPGVADDEPYPPAIAAAIQALAEAYGEDPSLVKVLSYNSVVWSNGCLEYPLPEESCTQALTPGWRIQLQLGGQEVEVHSDEMGGKIRWR